MMPMSDDEREVDPYSLEENYLRTDGRDCCHWCWFRPQEWVWGPYGTRVCDHCDRLASEGRGAEIVEEHAARMTVHGWPKLIRDPEGYRQRERERLDRWLEVRTAREPAPPHKPHRPDPNYTEPEWLREIRQLPDEPLNLDDL